MKTFETWAGFTDYILHEGLEVYDMKGKIVHIRDTKNKEVKESVLLDIK